MRHLERLIFCAFFSILFAGTAFGSTTARFGRVCPIAYTDAAPEVPPAPFVPVDILPPNTNLRTVHLEPLPLPTTDGGPEFLRSRQILVSMLAATSFENASRKYTLEKGKLRLGRDLGEGRSLEFEYEGDYRTGQMILRLAKILLFKPNGQVVVLHKAPIADSGKTLAVKSVSFTETTAGESNELEIEIKELDPAALKTWAGEHKELAERLEANRALGPVGSLEAARDLLTENDRAVLDQFVTQQKTIQVPVTIEGPLMDELKLWIKRLPFVSRDELKQANTNRSIDWLKWSARRRGGQAFGKRIIQRQSFKLAMFAAIIYGVEKLEMIDISAVIPASSKIERLLHGQRADVEMQIVKQVVGDLDVPRSEIEGLEAKAASRITAAVQRKDIFEEFKLKMDKQVRKEAALGGNARFIEADVNDLKVPSLPNGQFAYMIADFPLQKKLVLVPIVKADNGTQTKVTMIPIGEHEFPETYRRVRQHLDADKAKK